MIAGDGIELLFFNGSSTSTLRIYMLDAFASCCYYTYDRTTDQEFDVEEDLSNWP